MAYREAILDFQGIHLAALTGQNGAGKSSLLDAMTWSIWGKARARQDDELIRLGQTEMEVEFTFALNDSVYRIIRKRDAGKRGRTSLNLHVEDAGGWRTLTEASMRATEKKISQIMRLDYDTFINSAFLLQGRADEFTTKRPAERKKILSDILGLDIYDVYVERAKKRADEKETEAAIITTEINQIDQELARESEYRTELAMAEKEAAELNEALQSVEAEMLRLRDQHRALNDKQRQLDDLRDRLTKTEADLADLAEAITEAETSIRDCQAILARRADIEAGLAQLQQAREAVKDWEQRLQESVKLADRKHELDRAFQTAQAAVEADLREVTTTIDLLSPKVAALTTQRSELAKAQAELNTLQRLEIEQEEYRQLLIALGPEQARLEEQNKQLKLEMDEIKANLSRLEEAAFICPICKRPLDELHRAEVAAQFRTEGKAKGDLFRANRARLLEIDDQQRLRQQQLAEIDKKVRDLARVQRDVARLEQVLQEAEEAAAKLEAAKVKQLKLHKRLETREFATEVLANLADVEAELAALGYDKIAHEQAQARIEELIVFEAEGHRLKEAGKRIEAEQKRLEREQARRVRLLEQSAIDREKITQLEQETTGLAELIKQLNQASDELTRVQRNYRFAQEKVGSAKQKLGNIAYQAKRRSEQETRLQQVREALGIYRELQTAFGKKGVQALLIESAIPEIEDEANRLLSRMTDGRMHVRFETQREARSSDSTIETLDIRIADEMGSRDYELYSGGEAFRINFAIRVAISKVLARRAGARLQTLMLDEGFGTQDVEGRERLVEAINAIQDDFEKIIVITHIDELKDAFPVHIDIWKTGEGSHVAIR
jgi:exonuclease SbcC